MAKEILEWDLTLDETAELKERTYARVGRSRLLYDLQRLLGQAAEQESAWWDALTERLKIPNKQRFNLIADPRTGKVWVKGRVKELDDTVPLTTDSPAI